MSARSIEQVLRDHPLAPDQNIRVVNLGSTSNVSHHIVQVRAAESLHVHQRHDLTVYVYRGHGEMAVATTRFKVRAGDVIFIPKAVPHAFQNSSPRPSVAIVMFAPAYDGTDTVPAADVHK